MPWQPLARLNNGAAFFTPVSNSASMPGLMSIWAISVIMFFGSLDMSKRSPDGAPAKSGAGREACPGFRFRLRAPRFGGLEPAVARTVSGGGSLHPSYLSERRTKDAKHRRSGDQECQQRSAPARRFDRGEQRQAGQRHDGGERQVVARIGVHQPTGREMPAVAVGDVDRKSRDERQRSGDDDGVER